MNYKILSNIMSKFFNNKTFHSTTDEIKMKKISKKEKIKFPCEKQEHIYINGKEFIFHHYKQKYKDKLLYFPGGSFIDPPTSLHYKFAKRLSKKLKMHIIMVQYPLFPESDPLTTAKLLKELCIIYNYINIPIMGDSAGANLAALLLYCFQKDNYNYINKVILLSPFVDKNINNPERLLISDYDFILNFENCKTLVNEVYCDYLKDGKNVFPDINSFKYNTDVLIFSGEKELFTPDIRKWVKSVKKLNVTHYIYKDMCHCFNIINTKQSKDSVKKIKIFLNKSIDY